MNRTFALTPFLLLVAVALCAGGQTVQLAAPTIEAKPGEEFVIPISFRNAPGLGAIEFDLCYDREVLEAVAVEQGPLAQGMLAEVRTTVPGFVLAAFAAGQGGAKGDGIILNVTFRAKGEAGATARLSFEKVRAWRGDDDYEVAVELREGKVTVVSALPWPLIGAVAGGAVVVLLVLLAITRKRTGPARAAAPAQLACPKCGSPVAPGAKFCPECGQPLAPQPQAALAPVPVQKGGGGLRAVLVTLILLVILGVGGLAGHQWWQRYQRTKADEAAAKAPPASSLVPPSTEGARTQPTP